MNSVIDRYRRQRAPSPSQCEPKPEPCSTCGRLECLCRPRFFAGQILTADDLNRLDYYIRAKHRLHNRQLHGWGVVNGLEVSCDVCGPGVVVGCGYALGPCGDDIVVCDPIVVDVCALIGKCKGSERPQPCEPPGFPTPAGCEQGDEEWILAIRYSEAPTRAVKPLMAATNGGCGCSAPGSNHCSCGGTCPNGQCPCGNGTARSAPRIAPVQCEPTVVCEGFAFDVYRKPPDPDPGSNDDRLRLNPDSELYKRFECCTELLLRRIPKMPGPLTLSHIQSNLVAWHNWVCSFKEYLQIYLSGKPGYNCALLARLNLIVCPPVNANNAALLILQTAVLLLLVWLDALLACFCSALLPPCPTAHPSDLVPLASIRVSATPCRVLSICNWTRHRKFATTFPALQYWLAILPFGVELRQLLDQLCCFQIAEIFTPRQTDATGSTGGFMPGPNLASSLFRAAAEHGGNGAGGAGGGDTGGDTGSGDGTPGGGDGSGDPGFAGSQPLLYERASRRLNPSSPNPDRLQAATRLTGQALARGRGLLDPQMFVESVFLPDKDKGDEHLSSLELGNLPQFFALEQLLRPVANASASIDALAPAFEALGVFGAGLRGEAEAPSPAAEARAPKARASARGAKAEGESTAEAVAAAATEIDAMKKEIAELRKGLADQAAELKRQKEPGRRRKEK